MKISMQTGVVGNNLPLYSNMTVPKKLPQKSINSPMISDTSKIMLGLSTIGLATLTILAVKNNGLIKKLPH